MAPKVVKFIRWRNRIWYNRLPYDLHLYRRKDDKEPYAIWKVHGKPATLDEHKIVLEPAIEIDGEPFGSVVTHTTYTLPKDPESLIPAYDDAIGYLVTNMIPDYYPGRNDFIGVDAISGAVRSTVKVPNPEGDEVTYGTMIGVTGFITFAPR